MPRRRAIDLAVVIVALGLVLLVSVLRASRPQAAFSVPSTYDTGGNGYAALYEFLQREGLSVSRFERPVGELRQRSGALVLAGDRAIFAVASNANALRALDAWVRAGGTLIVLGETLQRDRDALGLPLPHAIHKTGIASVGCPLTGTRALRVGAEFTQAYAPACGRDRATLLSASGKAAMLTHRRGRGTVIAATTAEIFGNRQLAQNDNAAFAYAIFAGLGPVTFDERIYGHATGHTFWEVLPQPMRISIVLALVALGLAILGANLPFAPPAPLEAPAERDSGAYIASLARMLQRGGAAHEIVARLARHAHTVLAPRAAGDERANALLEEFEGLKTHPRPGPREVLAAGRLFATVQKEYEW